MMGEILFALIKYLRATFVLDVPPTDLPEDDPRRVFGIKGVYGMSDFTRDMVVRPDMIPCMVVATLGEGDEDGPFGNTKTRIFNYHLRIMARSADPQKYMNAMNPYNVFSLSDAVRLALAKNKFLGINQQAGKYARLDTSLAVADTDYIDGIGHVNARDFTLTYKVLETWTGERNNQNTLLAPDPQPLAV